MSLALAFLRDISIYCPQYENFFDVNPYTSQHVLLCMPLGKKTIFKSILYNCFMYLKYFQICISTLLVLHSVLHILLTRYNNYTHKLHTSHIYL